MPGLLCPLVRQQSAPIGLKMTVCAKKIKTVLCDSRRSVSSVTLSLILAQIEELLIPSLLDILLTAQGYNLFSYFLYISSYTE